MKNILPLLADFANGIFATLLAGYVTHTEVVWWYFLVGIPLAMLPDLDALPELLTRGKVAASSNYQSDHRDGLHYPVLFLITGVCASMYFGFFGYLFLFATMLHFCNDLYGTGWGIQLFWPFSKRRYKLFGNKVNQSKEMLVNGTPSVVANSTLDTVHTVQPVVSWSEDELPEYIKRFGFDDWIDRIYLTVNWISVTEYSLFVLSLVLLIMTLVY